MTALAVARESRWAKQAMDAGDSNVVDAGDASAEEFGGDGGLFGGVEIAGSGAEDGDVAPWLGSGRLAQRDGPRLLVIFGSRGDGKDGCGSGLVGAGGENVGAGRGHAGEDLGGMCRRTCLRRR